MNLGDCTVRGDRSFMSHIATTGMPPKNWDKIVRQLSSPESSDAEDDLNVMSVCKNAARVAQVVNGITNPDDQRAPPLRGTNRFSDLSDRLTKSFVESQQLLHHLSSRRKEEGGDLERVTDPSSVTRSSPPPPHEREQGEEREQATVPPESERS